MDAGAPNRGTVCLGTMRALILRKVKTSSDPGPDPHPYPCPVSLDIVFIHPIDPVLSIHLHIFIHNAQPGSTHRVLVPPSTFLAPLIHPPHTQTSTTSHDLTIIGVLEMQVWSRDPHQLQIQE